jgi:hypothetical protein
VYNDDQRLELAGVVQSGSCSIAEAT